MLWTEVQLLEVLAEMRARRGDTTSIEIKRASGGMPELADTICAFANMPEGGTIVLGIDEAGGAFEIVGVSDIAKFEASLAATARSRVHPAPHLEFQTFELNDRHVLVAHVSPLRVADRPAYVGDRAYLRQSDGDYTMQPHEIRMLEVAKLHSDERTNYDLEPALGRTLDDLVPDMVESYTEAVRSHDQRLRNASDQEVLNLTNVLNSAGVPTLAGLYALGMYPQGHYPALTVTAAVQLPSGERQARNKNLQDFSGPVPVLLEDLMEWVSSNLGTVHRYRSDGHMEVLSELPLDAVRELIANALVHRDLGPSSIGTGKSIQIRLTPRNLFIQSPGGLRGVSLKQIESVEHAQAAVNQRLYQISKRLQTSDGASVIEGEGGGIRQVFHSAAERGLPRPQLIDTGVQFKALLWRPDASLAHRDSREPEHRTDMTSAALPHLRSSAPTRNESVVLAALISNGEALSIHEISEATGLNLSQVRYALAQPIEDGFVIMDGRQGLKTTRYYLSPFGTPADADSQ